MFQDLEYSTYSSVKRVSMASTTELEWLIRPGLLETHMKRIRHSGLGNIHGTQATHSLRCKASALQRTGICSLSSACHPPGTRRVLANLDSHMTHPPLGVRPSDST